MKNKKTPNILEKDMYIPVRDFFQEQEYTVRGEVKCCDVLAVRDDEVIAVEMKTTLNLDVILQAIDRQQISEIVYIAVPKKKKAIRTKRWSSICKLLKKVEIGLLLVSFEKDAHNVEEYIKPKMQKNTSKPKSKPNRKRATALKEFYDRHGDYNTGGTTGEKIITSYREKAIHIAALLLLHESLSIKELKDMGTDHKKTASILQDNYYEWFEREKKGVYRLSSKGILEIEEYNELIKIYLS